MSGTDMVRCKSLVEATRVMIVEVMSKEPMVERDVQHEGGAEMDEDEDEDEDMDDVDEVKDLEDLDGENTWGPTATRDGESTWDADEDGHSMNVARVYAGTIMELGYSLPGDDAPAGSG